ILAGNLRLPLRSLIEEQITAHQIARSRAGAASADELAALRDIHREIARHGMFGAALEAVIERLKGGGKAPSVDEGSHLGGLRRSVPAIAADLLGFFHDRLKVHLRGEGIRHDVIDAVLNMPGNDDLTLLVRRARALQAVLDTDDGANLIQGFRRANNILAQAEAADGVEYSFGPDVKFAEHDAERALFAALDEAEAKIGPAMEAEDFEAAMAAMAALRAPIDAFFEAVQINTENQVVRRNRLNLLARIRDICLSVADLTRIEG
ncbi:MAG: glycine--tRNA ligase subunit beta, partial [Alphaproteobacteria bacterium]